MISNEEFDDDLVLPPHLRNEPFPTRRGGGNSTVDDATRHSTRSSGRVPRETPSDNGERPNFFGLPSREKIISTVKNAWDEVRGGKAENGRYDDDFVLFDRSIDLDTSEKKSSCIGKFFQTSYAGTIAVGSLAMVLILTLTITLICMQYGRAANYNVAFIGSYYLAINDIPRLMETISEGHIRQNSCINTKTSLAEILRTGNGMYYHWNTDKAIITNNLSKNYDSEYTFYDFGACSVFQLIEGYDYDLVYKNYNGAYYDDGNNPCFDDYYYLGLIQDRMAAQAIYWDFVILNDPTNTMISADARAETVSALKYVYAPMIKDAAAIPILIDTHAFHWDYGNDTDDMMSNMTDGASYFLSEFDVVAHLTATIYAGLREYYLALKFNLPDELAPRIAPVALAFLTVHDEKYQIWQKLMLSDGINASPSGSYLIACVIYATIYGHLPKRAGALGGMESLFSRSRDLEGYPNDEVANYLRHVAKKVVLGGYVPESLQLYTGVNFKLGRKGDVFESWEYQAYSNGYNGFVGSNETQTDWANQTYPPS